MAQQYNPAMRGIDVQIVGLTQYNGEHLVVQNEVIDFVLVFFNGRLAFQAIHRNTGTMVGHLARQHIARVRRLPAQFRNGIVSFVPLSNIPQHIHSQIRRGSHLTHHCATVTLIVRADLV